MKTMFVIAAALFSVSSFAISHVDLQPGAEMRVSAGEDVTVTCRGSGGEHFCTCGHSISFPSNYLVRHDILRAQIERTQIQGYVTEADCLANIDKHPACR